MFRAMNSRVPAGGRPSTAGSSVKNSRYSAGNQRASSEHVANPGLARHAVFARQGARQRFDAAGMKVDTEISERRDAEPVPERLPVAD